MFGHSSLQNELWNRKLAITETTALSSLDFASRLLAHKLFKTIC